MRIVSEIAEILASAIDCVLVMWFFLKYFGTKKRIAWWKYFIWLVIFFIDAQFVNGNPNLQAFLMILISCVFAFLYLKGKAVIKVIAILIIYILMTFINIGIIQLVAVFGGVSIEKLIVSGTALRILVLCISKLTLLLAFYLLENFYDKKHYMEKEEGVFLVALYAIFFLVSILSVKIIVKAGLRDVQQIDFMVLSLLILMINIFLFWMTDKMTNQKR